MAAGAYGPFTRCPLVRRNRSRHLSFLVWRGVWRDTMTRLSILAALLLVLTALPAEARVHPVKGAAHGTVTAERGVGHGAVQAGRGIGHGAVTAVRGIGRGAKCLITLGTRCG